MNRGSNIAGWLMVTKSIIVLIILGALGVGGYFAYKQVAGFLLKGSEVAEDTGNFLSGKPTVHGAALGASCKVGADCKGYTSALAEKGGTACCGGSCTLTQKDFMNVWYCPSECKGWLGAPGDTCGAKSADGQTCVAHEQCANWHGLLQQGSGCDGGRCVPMKKDWFGAWWIPSDCGRRWPPLLLIKPGCFLDKICDRLLGYGQGRVVNLLALGKDATNLENAQRYYSRIHRQDAAFQIGRRFGSNGRGLPLSFVFQHPPISLKYAGFAINRTGNSDVGTLASLRSNTCDAGIPICSAAH